MKDHIIQNVQKTYKNGQDITESLRDLTKKDLSANRPTRTISVADTDDANRKVEQDGLDILYQADIMRFLDRAETQKQKLNKS